MRVYLSFPVHELSLGTTKCLLVGRVLGRLWSLNRYAGGVEECQVEPCVSQ